MFHVLIFTIAATLPILASAYPVEIVPTNCQNLDAAKSVPISLTGKIFSTYLPEGRRYTKLKPTSPPDYFEIGTLDLNSKGHEIKRYTFDSTHDAEIAVSSDGKWLTWTRRPLLDGFDGSNSIVVAPANNPSAFHVIAYEKDAYLGIPTFADKSGQVVMYSKQGDKDPFTKLVFHQLKSGKKRTLKTKFRGSINDPMLSPDGRWIAFKSYEQNDTEEAQLYIMKSDGTNVRRLTKTGYQDEDPAFSPDGRYLAFERALELTPHQGQNANDMYFQVGIVLLDLKTGEERQLTEPDPCGKNELWLPTWSPDGELIMMTRGLHLENGEFVHDLWVMRKDGRDLQRVPGSDGIMFFDWIN